MMAGLSAAVLGLAPVLCFLAVLRWMDGYKLTSLRFVGAVVAAGALAAGLAFAANAQALALAPMEAAAFTRYVAPLVEEAAKALVVLALVRAHRVAFLVDAAICGFAVGAGFALVENLWYLYHSPAMGAGTWIVRGFGTALMHGGATALFALMGIARSERRGGAIAWLPGLGVAILLHAAFNQFLFSPLASAALMVAVLPPLMHAVFTRSEKAVGDWLGKGFDADAEMLRLINSGTLAESPVGRYLHELKDRFHGPVVADLLCYLRLYTELSLRAKGILMMRENGFEAAVDDETRARFAEMEFLEGSIGRTGLLALEPLLRMGRKELWQLYMLGK
jgi:RsiW-degrading membrane proteinase PrsW (M82 family)